MRLPKITRKDLKPDECLCSYCTAKCCRYFALPMETPETREDFENIRWFMLHGRVGVFVEDDVWYLCVYSDCRHLQADQRCGIYETRPEICREYSTDNCEYDDDAVYDMFFETPEQIWEYTQARFPQAAPRKFSTAMPTIHEKSLPIVG